MIAISVLWFVLILLVSSSLVSEVKAVKKIWKKRK